MSLLRRQQTQQPTLRLKFENSMVRPKVVIREDRVTFENISSLLLVSAATRATGTDEALACAPLSYGTNAVDSSLGTLVVAAMEA